MNRTQGAPQPDADRENPGGAGVVRTLVRGTAIYAVANLAVRGINVVLVPVYTRFLSPADYGIVYLAETVATVLAVVATLGLSGAMRRMYFQHADDPIALGRYLSGVLWTVMLSFVAFGVAGVLLGPAVLRAVAPGFKVPFFPFIAISIVTALITRAIDLPMSLYQTENRPGTYSCIAIVFTLLTAAAVLWQVAGVRAGALGMLRGKLVAASVLLGIVGVGAWRRFRFRPDWQGVRETFPISLPLVPHEFMALGLIMADRFIMERYRSLSEIGLYSLAYTLGMVMYLVTNSVTSAWNPTFFDLARREESRPLLGRVTMGLVTVFAAVATFGSLTAPGVIEGLLDPRYYAAGRLVPIVIAAYLLHALFSLFQLSALQAKKSWLLWVSSAIALALNIGLNFWWVPRWGMFGAAYATLAAYAVEATIMFAGAQSAFRLPLPISKLLFSVSIAGASVAITQRNWAGHWPKVSLVSSGIAIAVLWLTNREEVRHVLEILRRRVQAGQDTT
jgi:O-antigen/teichoic acid export membrane protein